MTSQTAPVQCHPIGVVHTPFEARDEAPRQGCIAEACGTIELLAEYSAGVAGLEAGDELDVVWFADRADRDVLEARGRGVFTTRSPARPNPLCVTRCTVCAVSDDRRRIDVRGVDMLDESPVLDLKAPMG